VQEGLSTQSGEPRKDPEEQRPVLHMWSVREPVQRGQSGEGTAWSRGKHRTIQRIGRHPRKPWRGGGSDGLGGGGACSPGQRA
jgi:hypothetical protein